jgi:hypothetical protein
MAGGANRVAPCVIRPTVSGASGFRFLVRTPKMLRVVSAIFYFFRTSTVSAARERQSHAFSVA